MADAGFGGAEIDDGSAIMWQLCIHNLTEILSPSQRGIIDPINLSGHGRATAPWINVIIAALERAEGRGIHIDIAIEPCWPAAVPSITPDSEGATKELVDGKVPECHQR